MEDETIEEKQAPEKIRQITVVSMNESISIMTSYDETFEDLKKIVIELLKETKKLDIKRSEYE